MTGQQNKRNTARNVDVEDAVSKKLDDMVSYRIGRAIRQIRRKGGLSFRPPLLSREGIKSIWGYAFGGRLFFGILLAIALYNLILDTFGIREISNFDQLFYTLIAFIAGTALYLLGKLKEIVFWVRETTQLLGENIDDLNTKVGKRSKKTKSD